MACGIGIAPLVHLMPQATLAVIVIVPRVGMIKVPEFLAVWRTRGMAFSWALTALAGVLLGCTSTSNRRRGVS